MDLLFGHWLLQCFYLIIVPVNHMLHHGFSAAQGFRRYMYFVFLHFNWHAHIFIYLIFWVCAGFLKCSVFAWWIFRNFPLQPLWQRHLPHRLAGLPSPLALPFSHASECEPHHQHYLPRCLPLLGASIWCCLQASIVTQVFDLALSSFLLTNY